MIAKPSRSSASVIGKRRVREEVVPAHERVEPFLAEELAKRRHLRRRAVERRHRLAWSARFRTSSTMPKRPIERTAPTDGWRAARSASRSRHQPAGLRARCSISPSSSMTAIVASAAAHAERVAVVGQPARKRRVREVIGDLPPHADGAELHVRARQPLGHRDDVGHDVPVIRPRTTRRCGRSPPSPRRQSSGCRTCRRAPARPAGSRRAARGCRWCR